VVGGWDAAARVRHAIEQYLEVQLEGVEACREGAGHRHGEVSTGREQH
jgi:hypothetical protein